jgi:glyoxalase family protein
MTVLGLHHVTLICSNAQRTLDFYTRVLGLRLIKQTVNFDDPRGYHLFFGSPTGSPEWAISFFEWPAAPAGKPGIGGAHHFALRARDETTLLKWKRWLLDHNVRVDGPLGRHYFTSIYFRDPDGVLVEIATAGPGWLIDEDPEQLGMTYREPPAELQLHNRDRLEIQRQVWSEPIAEIDEDMALTGGLHHISAICADIEQTHIFLSSLLDLRRLKMTANFDDLSSAHWYWGVGDGAPGTIVSYFERRQERTSPAQSGVGQPHHFALAVPDEAALMALRESLMAAGCRVTSVKDRHYYKSFYTHDPDKQIIELTAISAGFMIDEAEAELGEKLMLPPWLEDQRDAIAGRLRPLERHDWDSAGAGT